MIVPISKVTFVNKAEITGPKYYKDELTILQNSGAVTMVQIPGYLKDDGPNEPACKIVIGINSSGSIMNNSANKAVFPCPPKCKPPGTGGPKVTLSSFLNQ